MAEPAGDTKLCNNCKRQISVNNFVMHEMHCKRHISLCERCHEPIPKGELEMHFEDNHAKIACEKCGEKVEKMKLEDHEENTCPKKPTKCLYCELEFPKRDLPPHLDYCGSRTEPCGKCEQYIMLKDQLKHEETNCKFPVVKPTNNNRSDGQGLAFMKTKPEGYLDRLAMQRSPFEEFSDVFGSHPEPRPTPGIPHIARGQMQLDRDMFVGGEHSTRQPHRTNGAVKVPNRAAAGNKSQLNKEIGAATNSIDPSLENDYDRLLAMHLAHDLIPGVPGDDVHDLLQPTEHVASPITPASHDVSTRYMDSYSEDLIMIPCEFCSEPFTADDLVQHQSGCSLDRISSVLSKYSSGDSRHGDANYAGDRSTTEQLLPSSAILDNLRNFREFDWVDDTVETVGGGDDAMMLPCEFCSELFPIDVLVQHQAMCDTTVTPRVTSPVDIRPKQKRKTPVTNAERLAADLPNLSSRRHQVAPFRNLDNDSDDENNSPGTGATHRVRKPRLTGITNNSSVTTTRSTAARKPGTDLHDRDDRYANRNISITQSSYARQGSNPKTSGHSDTHVTTNVRTGGYAAQAAAKKQASTSRNKSSLDSLLGDSDHGSHDLLGHIRVGPPKSQKNDVNSRQRVVPSQAVARGLVKTKPPTTTTTTRERDLNKFGVQSTSVGQPKPRAPRAPLELRSRPGDTDDSTGSTRQRTRANHVFGAPANPVRRRSENS